MSPDWVMDEQDGLAVMRFGLLAGHGIRHGLVVREGGAELDDEEVYLMFSSRGPTVVTEQTHSTEAARIGPGFATFYPERLPVDGMTSGLPGVRLTIHTADCVPVFLSLPGGRAVGLFHCGWRGTAGGFIRKAVAAMAAEYRTGADEMLAVVGPAIEAGCYPVGREVARRFPEGSLAPGPEGKWLLDLKSENRRQLLEAGLREAGIQVSPLCTRCRPDLFHSYRREGAALRGKMVAFIEAGHEEERG